MKRSVPRLSGHAKRVARAELIGLDCEVVQSPDAGLVGLRGEVVDETMHTLTLRIGGPGGRCVQVAKHAGTFRFAGDGDVVDIDGRAIRFRPEDRTKKVK